MQLLDCITEGICCAPINVPGLKTVYRSAQLAKVEMLGAHILELVIPMGVSSDVHLRISNKSYCITHHFRSKRKVHMGIQIQIPRKQWERRT